MAWLTLNGGCDIIYVITLRARLLDKSEFERIINMSRQIRTSAKAVIIKNGKLLAIKLNDGKEEWYILPGGGQDDEEILPQTVEREVKEEVEVEVK